MKEEIIRMANEAGLYHFYDSEGHCTGITNARLVTQDKDRWDDRLVEMLAPFAALVRADERDACAKVCASLDETDMRSRYDYRRGVLDCVDAIRAREQA